MYTLQERSHAGDHLFGHFLLGHVAGVFEDHRFGVLETCRQGQGLTAARQSIRRAPDQQHRALH
ncbi:MAG: hypothetical protein OXF96_03425, partial [Chloroflexi bacterium]|nr:hypothetical protein [Chloroflexota bacterium]